jgi:hypothetical protein
MASYKVIQRGTGGVGARAPRQVRGAPDDMAALWPRIGDKGGYRAELDATSPYHGDFPRGHAGGTGTALDDAVRTAVARCVDAATAVVESS